MTKCYLVNHNYLSGRESSIVAEIEKIDPNILIGLCLEEYDYHFIYRNFIVLIQPYLTRTNKKMKLIVPYVALPELPNIVVEKSFGYYLWSCESIDNAIRDNVQFKFTESTKLFTNYNNNDKYQRAMLIDEFVKNDLLKDGIVTLNKPGMRIPEGSLYVYKYHDGSKLVDEADFVLNSSDAFIANAFPKNYLNGFIDIVSESTYNTGQFFITEKTTKPIAVCKPFIIFGPPMIHKYLYDNFGIEYYTELFDYSFDEEEDIEKRIDGIVKNLIRLRQLSKADLLSMHESIKDKLISNRTKYLQIRTDIAYIPESLKFLQHKNNVDCYGDLDAGILGSLEIK
jgi:hypothetical protein